ncbi:MAG: trypsin-like peptidase domain-containing protein [Nanoarchaeota archaeon]
MAAYKRTNNIQTNPVQHLVLKKHHKIVIGSFTTIVIVYMIVTAILLNGLIVKQSVNNKDLTNKINSLQADTQSKLNDLTSGLMKTSEQVNSLGSQVGSIDKEFSSLKASVSEDFSGVIEQVIPSVVTIRTDIGQGTGFVLANGGYVVTNAHVLSGKNSVQAINYKQEIINANLIGEDENYDIALLKINGSYIPLQLADSNNVQIGEKVIAIGNPLGLQFSVSQGIVSGVHRAGPNNLLAYIQTDAALNPGNSGGPLIDKNGDVVGINNFKIGSGESLGFALESNFIKDAVNRISLEKLNQTLIQ